MQSTKLMILWHSLLAPSFPATPLRLTYFLLCGFWWLSLFSSPFTCSILRGFFLFQSFFSLPPILSSLFENSILIYSVFNLFQFKLKVPWLLWILTIYVHVWPHSELLGLLPLITHLPRLLLDYISLSSRVARYSTGCLFQQTMKCLSETQIQFWDAQISGGDGKKNIFIW